jgi:hypothetical protein
MLVMDQHLRICVEDQIGEAPTLRPLRALLQEVTRHLHNYLAASKTLVDHSREYVKDAFGETSEAFRAYEKEVSARFGSLPVSRFTMDLRNQFAHARMPSIASVTRPGATCDNDRHTLVLKVPDAKNHKRWHTRSRDFIATHNGEVDLLKLVTTYNAAVLDFYGWFGKRVAEWGKVERDKMLEMHKRLGESVE